MKKVAGKLRLDLAQYRELAAFAQFGTAELDAATRAQLDRGQRITEVLKQTQFVPMSLENQVIILYAAINGYLDDIPVGRVAAFENDLLRFMQTSQPAVGQAIAEEKDINDKSEKVLKKAIEEFKQGFLT